MDHPHTQPLETEAVSLATGPTEVIHAQDSVSGVPFKPRHGQAGADEPTNAGDEDPHGASLERHASTIWWTVSASVTVISQAG
jgi:hypothetical protein